MCWKKNYNLDVLNSHHKFDRRIIIGYNMSKIEYSNTGAKYYGLKCNWRNLHGGKIKTGRKGNRFF